MPETDVWLGLAKEAFDAYGDEAQWLTWDNKPMPQWDKVGEIVQKRWVASVKRTAAILHVNVDRSNEFPLLEDKEWDVYSVLSTAWNRFIELPTLHPNDNIDFAHHINALKNIIMSRPVAKIMAGMKWNGYIVLAEPDHK
jgi:hypothetical protein